MRPTHARTRTRALSASILSAFALVVGLIGGVSAPATAADSTSAVSLAAVGSNAANIVQAADLSKFQAGRIVDDAVFYDSKTMTEAQIQSFLNSKVKTCQSGYVCLKDFKQTTTNKSKDQMCNGYTGGANESAARIIYKVSQSCGMNPRVILVMLQKEQGLVTHTWPSSWRYDAALGQDCPDTPAGCSDAYKGFFSQIYGGMWQMKRYTNPPGTSNYFNWYPVGQTSQVRYNPNAACGSGPVLIQNKATASLYYYTPYQPNAAAIRAGYGEGDACSAYGNRNFFSYFNDWFGSTLGGGTTTPPFTPTDPSQFPAPKWSSTDSDGAVYAVSGSDLWAYPLNSARWGDRVRVASGLSSPVSVAAVGDLNGDSHRDLVVHQSNGKVMLYAGDGAGFMAGAVELPIPGSDVRQILGAGDFNGDERSDLIAVMKDGTLQLWSGHNGGVTGPRQVGSGWKTLDQITAGIDFDGDGNSDIVARKSDGSLMLYPGDGKGAWLPERRIGTGWLSMTAIVASADVTNDGNVDVVARNSAGNIIVYSTDGKAKFGTRYYSGHGWHTLGQLLSTGPSTENPIAPGTVGGDVTGDGLVDVLAINGAGKLIVYPSNGRGGWEATRPDLGAVTTPARLIKLGDFDSDGSGDFGRVDSAGAFWLYSGANLTAPPRKIGQGWSLTLFIGDIDWDSDGNTDLLARKSDGTLWVYRGDGTGGFADSTRVGSGWNDFKYAFSAGDLDGNGTQDMLAVRSNGTLWNYSMSGDSRWAGWYQVASGFETMTYVGSGGDFDQDGFQDVIARATDGRLLLFRGDGEGHLPFQAVTVGTGWTWTKVLG